MVPRGAPRPLLYNATTNPAQPWNVRISQPAQVRRRETRFPDPGARAHSTRRSSKWNTCARGRTGRREPGPALAARTADTARPVCRQTAPQPWKARTFATRAGGPRSSSGPMPGVGSPPMVPRGTPRPLLYKATRNPAQPWNVRISQPAQVRRRETRFPDPGARGPFYAQVFQVEYVRERPYSATRTRPSARGANSRHPKGRFAGRPPRNRGKWGPSLTGQEDRALPRAQCPVSVLRPWFHVEHHARCSTTRPEPGPPQTAAQSWKVRTFATSAGGAGASSGPMPGVGSPPMVPRGTPRPLLYKATPNPAQPWNVRISQPAQVWRRETRFPDPGARGPFYAHVFQVKYVRERPYRATRTRPSARGANS